MRQPATWLLPARLALLFVVTVVVISGSSVASGAPAPGLVAAYSFDAGVGSVLADESANGNSGTISGATWTSDGKFGGALSFDGTNDWVEIADASSLDLTTGMTLEAWVKPSAAPSGWSTVLSKERNRLAYGLFAGEDTGRTAGQVAIGSEHTAIGDELPPGMWSHLATTYDGATLRLYLNGALSGSTPVSGSIRTSSGQLRIGGNSQGGRWFAGQIDEVRVYERALSSAELQADASTPVAPPPADTQAPTAPNGLSIEAQTQTSITLSWNPSSDNVGVTGYGHYRAGGLVNSGAGTTYAYTGLACGTSYTLGVDAYDAAGNRSSVSSVTAATSPCADTSSPSAPSGLAVQGRTQTGITVGWTASSDNVGVTGYGRYRNSSLVSSGTGTSYMFSGLTCGTSYSLGIDAYDAAGNRSTRSSLTTSTDACPEPPSSSLVGAYSFDAGTGSTLTDISGLGNAGAISGATWTAAGRNGGALSFDGVDDVVTVADAGSLDLATGMTLEAWVRPTTAGSWRTVVTKEQVGNLVYGLFSSSDSGQPSGIVSIGSSPIQDIVRGTSALALSTWTHLATTYDGAVLRLYVNGTQVGSTNVTGAYPNSAGPLQIGGNRIWPEWFQGQIDDLRVYNRALSAAELQSDMNSPVGGGTTPPPPPPPADTQPPSAPSGLAVGGQTQNGLTLTWNAATDNVGVTGYGVYRNGASVGSTSAATRNYSFSGLACGTTYSLAVDAVDAAGNRSSRSTVNGTTSTCAPPPPPGSGLANVWVDLSGGSCVRSGSPAAYVDGSACGSLSAAYAAAASGDTVLVAAGSYGPQTLPAGTKTLTIRNAPGATPVLSTTMVEASNITLAGLKIERNHDTGPYLATLEARGANNTYDGIDVNTKNMHARQGIGARGSNNTFRNGSSYNVTDEKAAWISGNNITVDHFDFYNVYQVGAEVHNECAYVIGANGFTIRNSRFWNCATMALYITRGSWYGAPPWGNVLIENNFFGHSTMGSGWHYYGLLFSGALAYDGAALNSFKVRYNTFENPVAFQNIFTLIGQNEWVGNLGGGWDCVPGMTYRYNVGKACSSTDRPVSPSSSCGPPSCATVITAPYGWRDPTNHDFHLTPGSPAIDRGDPNDHPPTDIDGQPRTGTPDAGADEYTP